MMRRTILLAAVAALVLAITTPSAAARQPEPIPTTCATHWLHNGWDVNGKQAFDFWYDEEGLLHHFGTGWMRANGDPYCQGSWWVEGNWVLNEATLTGEVWGTVRMELLDFDGGFEASYAGPGIPGEERFEAELSGEGYGALEGWQIWMFMDNGDLETGYVTPAK